MSDIPRAPWTVKKVVNEWKTKDGKKYVTEEWVVKGADQKEGDFIARCKAEDHAIALSDLPEMNQRISDLTEERDKFKGSARRLFDQVSEQQAEISKLKTETDELAKERYRLQGLLDDFAGGEED